MGTHDYHDAPDWPEDPPEDEAELGTRLVLEAEERDFQQYLRSLETFLG